MAAAALARSRCYLELRRSLKAGVRALPVASQRSVLQAFDASPFVGGARADALLPCRASLARVVAELAAEGVEPSAAAAIVDGLAEASAAGAAGFPEGGAASVSRASKDAWVASYGGAQFSVDAKRFQWLKRAHAREKAGDFATDVFALLCHYTTVANGNQAAIPAAVYATFERWARQPEGTVFEAYASALNHRRTRRPRRFGTAFPGVDGPFGGLGPFGAFRLPDDGGEHRLVLANPPFCPETLAELAPRVAGVLDDRTTCVVVVPAKAGRLGHDSAHLAALRALDPLAEETLAPHRHAFLPAAAFKPRARPANHPELESQLLVFSSRPSLSRTQAKVLSNALASTWAAAAKDARKARRLVKHAETRRRRGDAT